MIRVYVFLCLLGLACTVTAEAEAEEHEFTALKYKKCKSMFEVVSVEISPCKKDDENRCHFTHGDWPTIKIGFKPNRDVPALKAAVRAKIEQAFVSFHLEDDNACNGKNITCPLKAGEVYFYSQKVKIAREYPALNVMVNWLLNDPETFVNKKALPYYDEDEERIMNDVCVVFMAKVDEKEGEEE